MRDKRYVAYNLPSNGLEKNVCVCGGECVVMVSLGMLKYLGVKYAFRWFGKRKGYVCV